MLVNALLVRWANGYHVVEDAASLAEHGRYEGFLTLGAVQSIDEVERVASAYFARFSDPTVTTTVGVEPIGVGDVPFLDWSVADYVTAPNEVGVAESLRVLSLAVTEDEEGNPIYTPELDSLGEIYEQHLERWLSTMANGALAGSTAAASPPSSTSFGTPPASPRAVLPPYSQPGAVFVGQSGEWESEVAFRLVRVVVRLRVAGTSNTVVSIRKNGVELGTVTLAAGVKRAEADIGAVFAAEADVLSFAVTTAGAAATDLVVMPRGV